ncbi:MAG: peptidoglycan DD-metalloendopeptidase family protein [Chlorobiales bacterium]|nr:peptidoglycan DD-metalloendopeptidase family protein [Chlorobiales bacterium]
MMRMKRESGYRNRKAFFVCKTITLIVVLIGLLFGDTKIGTQVALAAKPFGTGETEKLARQRREVEQNLKLLQRQVKEYQQQLNNVTIGERQSMAAVQNLSNQLKLYEEIVFQLQLRQEDLRNQISQLEKDLKKSEKDLETMKADFTRYAIAIYKFGEERTVELVLSSRSVNQAIVRREYIKRFSGIGKLKIISIQKKTIEIADQKVALQRQYAEDRELLKEKQQQLETYRQRKEEREEILVQLRKDKKQFKEQLAQSKLKTAELQDKIRLLVEAEERAIRAEIARKKREEERQRQLAAEAEARRKAKEAEKAKLAEKGKETGKETGKEAEKTKTAEDKNRRSDVAIEREPAQPMLKESPEDFDYSSVSVDFDRNRGRLPWPVRGGVIVQAFGKNEDKDLKIITFNNGVDISVPIGSPVHAVAGGKVTQIAFLPTFGNIVIIRHSNSYITVYANLANVRVANGEIVSSGQEIGTSAKSQEGGSIVHFEVWKGKDKCDPEVWLAKK